MDIFRVSLIEKGTQVCNLFKSRPPACFLISSDIFVMLVYLILTVRLFTGRLSLLSLFC